MIGRAPVGAAVTLDDTPVRVTSDGIFVVGFHRDAAPEAVFTVALPGGDRETWTRAVAPRTCRVQRIDGLPPGKVTPPAERVARIRAEAALVRTVRAADTDAT